MSSLTKMILAAAAKLPPFPQVAQKVMALLDDPDVAVDALVEVVQMDPTITANVIKAANSPIYGLVHKVDNLAQALALLGNETFAEIVFTSASAKLLGREQPGYDLDQGDLWKHSLAVALMTQVICENVGRPPSSVLYTAALLHDIGKVALNRFVHSKYQQILEDVEKKGIPFLAAEREVLGLDHAELGARMVLDWNFSQEMAELIRCHHDPSPHPKDFDLAVLYIANTACQMIGLGGGADGVSPRWQEEAMELVGIKHFDLDLAMAELLIRLDKAEAMLGLSG